MKAYILKGVLTFKTCAAGSHPQARRLDSLLEKPTGPKEKSNR